MTTPTTHETEPSLPEKQHDHARCRIRFLLCFLLLSVLSGSWPAAAQNWAKIYTIGRLDKIACSGDGTKLMVFQREFDACVSSNSGATWTELAKPNSQYWLSAGLSQDGKVLVATLRRGGEPTVYTSTNFGATWIPGDAPTNLNWTFVSCSADGSRMTIGGYTYTIHGNIPAPIYASTNSGINWRQIADSGVAYCSGDGTKLFQVDASGIFKVSADFGGSWTPTLTNANGLAACSHDGGTVYAGANTNGTDVIYVSHDSGFNWTPAGTPDGVYIYPRACTADGAKVFASGNDGNVYSSTDSAATWTSNSIPLPAQGIACSSDAASVYAFFNVGDPDSGFTGNVFTPQAARLSIAPAGTNVILSWPTNYLAAFQLEANAGAATNNWTNVTATPEIVGDSFQATDAVAGGEKFFRLKSQ